MAKSKVKSAENAKSVQENDLGHWTLHHNCVSNVVDQEPYGFIYLITNKLQDRRYIGKKQCVRRIKRKPLKGKKRSRIDSAQSDWKTYTGSCKELNEDIAKYGKENFTFEILEWCYSKFELAYKEAKLQFDHDVLLSESYYNGIINLRIGRVPKSFALSNLSERKGDGC